MARLGDVEAFTQLAEARVAAMLRTAMAILGEEADARDAVQESMLTIWRQLPALREVDRFDAWATRVLVNQCRRQLRRRIRTRVREISLEGGTLSGERGPATLNPSSVGFPAIGDDPEGALLRRRAIEQAFERLTPDQRVLLVLRHLQGQPIAEIAEALRIPAGTVKSRLSAARHALDRALAREEA
jgi:RNA polymerase sigma-70 factor (ECF subfamily)